MQKVYTDSTDYDVSTPRGGFVPKPYRLERKKSEYIDYSPEDLQKILQPTNGKVQNPNKEISSPKDITLQMNLEDGGSLDSLNEIDQRLKRLEQMYDLMSEKIIKFDEQKMSKDKSVVGPIEEKIINRHDHNKKFNKDLHSISQRLNTIERATQHLNAKIDDSLNIKEPADSRAHDVKNIPNKANFIRTDKSLERELKFHSEEVKSYPTDAKKTLKPMGDLDESADKSEVAETVKKSHMHFEYNEDPQLSYSIDYRSVKSSSKITEKLIYACQRLPNNHKVSVCIKIDELDLTGNPVIAFGVAPKNIDSIADTRCSFVNPIENVAYQKNETIELKAKTFRVGSVLKIVWDPRIKLLKYLMNDIHLYSRIIDQKDVIDCDLYSCILICCCQNFRMSIF